MASNNKFSSRENVDLSESINSIKRLVKETTENKEENKVIHNFKNENRNFNIEERKEFIDRTEEKLSDEVKEIKDLLNKVIKNTNKEKEDDIISEYLRDLDIEEYLIKELNNKENIHYFCISSKLFHSPYSVCINCYKPNFFLF